MSSHSNFGSLSLRVHGGVEGMGVALLLELLEALGHRLPLALADLHLHDEGVKLDLVVDQGDLLGRVFLLDGVEIELLDGGGLRGPVRSGWRLGGRKPVGRLELLLTAGALVVLLQDGLEAGLLVFLELAGRLVRLLLLVEEVLGRGDPVVQLGALALQVAEVVEEASLHLRGVDVLDGGEAFPVDIFPGESREEDVDQFVGDVEVSGVLVVLHHVVDQDVRDGLAVHGRELLVQPVVDVGDLCKLSWHLKLK